MKNKVLPTLCINVMSALLRTYRSIAEMSLIDRYLR